MNAERRKIIAKAVAKMDEARALLEEARDGEQDAFDNMPASLQASARGESMESIIGEIESVIGDLEADAETGSVSV